LGLIAISLFLIVWTLVAGKRITDEIFFLGIEFIINLLILADFFGRVKLLGIVKYIR